MLTRDAATVLSVNGLSKKYCRDLRRSLWYGLGDIARELTRRKADERSARLRPSEFWALRDVSFKLERGDALAVVGANGAGKSTLLKILYGLFKPDAGSVRVAGRVGAMIELGTGFNPVLSGRENVQVNAAVLGFPRGRADELMDEIEEFAGLEGFLDTPVQYYSSGMQARLSYAVAAHLKPDVLLVDEVLAVGDTAYQRKCFAHMQRYLEAGGSLVFVSHSPYHVQSICRRGVLLEHGRMTYAGTAVETLNRYFETLNRVNGEDDAERALHPVLDEEHPVVIEDVRAESANGREIRTGADVTLVLKYRALADVKATWGFSVWTSDRWVCVTGGMDARARTLRAGAGELRCRVPRLPLAAGSYWLRAAVIDPQTMLPLALLGWRDAPRGLNVRTDASARANAAAAVNQLTVLDVEWE